MGIAWETATKKPPNLERVPVDTTIQPKTIVNPTDSRLYLEALLTLVDFRPPSMPSKRARAGWRRAMVYWINFRGNAQRTGRRDPHSSEQAKLLGKLGAKRTNFLNMVLKRNEKPKSLNQPNIKR